MGNVRWQTGTNGGEVLPKLTLRISLIEPATRPLPIASLPFRPPVAMTSLRLLLTASTELTTTAIFLAGFLSSFGDRMWASTVQKELKLIMAICIGVAERLDRP